MANGHAPAYNVQAAVDAEHAIIVAQQVTTEAYDQRSLLPMAEAAKQALGRSERLHVVADAGYSNGEHAEGCESQGIVPHCADQSGDQQPRRWHAVRPPDCSFMRRRPTPSAVRLGRRWSPPDSWDARISACKRSPRLREPASLRSWIGE